MLRQCKICLLFIMITTSLVSCKFLNWKNLDIKISIEDTQEYFSNEFIEVVFSYSPNIESVEKNMKLTQDNQNIQSIYVWEGNTCKIKPFVGWSFGAKYIFSINGIIETLENGVFSFSEKRFFYYGEENNWLVLEECNFENNQKVLDKEELIFKFNKEINENIFLNTYSINPTINMEVVFSEDKKTVTLYPKEKWGVNTTYSWTIKKAKASDGYPLLKEYTGTFMTETDFVLPELLGVYPVEKEEENYFWKKTISLDTLENGQCIGFEFSKAMNEKTIIDAISFLPAIKGYFVNYDDTNTKFIFIPTSDFLIETEYLITVKKGACDFRGFSIYEDKDYYFTTSLKMLEITETSFIPRGGSVIDLLLTDIPEVNLKPLPNKETEYGDDVINISFSTKIDNSLKDKIRSYISIKPVFPASSKTPSIRRIYWTTDNSLSIYIQENSFSFSTDEVDYFYELKISGGSNGIQNIKGEYMKEDFKKCFVTKLAL